MLEDLGPGQNNVNSQKLYTQAELDAAVAAAMADIQNNPNSYNLYTKEQYDANYNAGKAAGDVKHTVQLKQSYNGDNQRGQILLYSDGRLIYSTSHAQIYVILGEIGSGKSFSI